MPSTILEIDAGEHHRRDCPVFAPLPSTTLAGPLALIDDAGTVVPAQRLGDRLIFVVERLDRGARRRYRLDVGANHQDGVALVEHKEAIDFTVGGDEFTTYRHDSNEVRPYFYPLIGPTGTRMTRSFPMEPGVDGESTDHPHHRSLYVAFGEVNGVDVWAEPPNPNTGRIVHRAWDSVTSGPVAAELKERLDWLDASGHPLLDERRRITVYATWGVRLLELDLELRPSKGAVLFGDTKEGGPLAIRVASAIEGARGGVIENAFGGRRERETWGKRAPWVDYTGVIGAETVGVTLMDHPTSFRHPTWWHVRDYGLFAANPFGTSAFTGDPSQRGDFVLVPGESLTFHYRVCLHAGNTADAQVADRYHDYANPPVATWS